MSPKFVFSALAVAGLLGCGGGSDDGTAIPGGMSAAVAPSPSTTSSAEGLWQGTTSASRTLRAVVLEDGTYWALYSGVNNPNVIAGVVQGSGISSPGSFSSANGRDFSIEAAYIADATLSASYSAKQSFNGSLTDQASGGAVSFTSTYRSIYEQSASLSALAGTYSGTAATGSGTNRTTIAIDSSGFVSGTSNDGCRFNGSTSVHRTVNVYDVTIVFQGGTCANGTSTTNGIAYLEGSNLYSAALNTARSNGFVVTAARTNAAVTTITTGNASAVSTPTASGNSGCGSRGGPGYRLRNGNCASWDDYYRGRT
jgi:hypothetical protein